MSSNERMIKLATATPTTLAQVDRVLEGRARVDDFDEVNIKTITKAEAAKRIGCSRPTMYRILRSGEIKTVFLRGVERVVLSSLIEHINGGGKPPAETK